MELKRILGLDSRSATAEAVAMYGRDALIISNEKINGKVELIVAVDLENDEFNTLEPAGLQFRSKLDEGAAKAAIRRQGFGQIMNDRMVEMTEPLMSSPKTDAWETIQRTTERLEYGRAKDLVEMLRGEFAEIRREMRISQQLAGGQAAPLINEAVKPLSLALVESGVPVGLRSLLVDAFQGLDDLGEAISMVESMLMAGVRREKKENKLEGINVIAGPSGSGKTMMVGRLAATYVNSGALQYEKVAIVSYCDRRPGAWNQVQVLAAQAGVDSYRVTDAAMLDSLLPELGHRTLVLVDTPGVEVFEHLHSISSTLGKSDITPRYHLLLPADASAATLRRYLEQADVRWTSMMLSKIDESSQPWPVIQALCDIRLPLTFSSNGPCGVESLVEAGADALVRIAMSNLPRAAEEGMVAFNAGSSRTIPSVWRSNRKELQ